MRPAGLDAAMGHPRTRIGQDRAGGHTEEGADEQADSKCASHGDGVPDVQTANLATARQRPASRYTGAGWLNPASPPAGDAPGLPHSKTAPGFPGAALPCLAYARLAEARGLRPRPGSERQRTGMLTR